MLDTYDLITVTHSKVKVSGTYILQQATVPLDHTQLESLTVVPMGTPLDQLNGLEGQPSIAQFAATTPLYTDGGSLTFDGETGTYTFTSGDGSSGAGIGSLGGLANGFQGITDVLGLGGILLWGGSGIFSPARGLSNLTDLGGFGWEREAEDL